MDVRALCRPTTAARAQCHAAATSPFIIGVAWLSSCPSLCPLLVNIARGMDKAGRDLTDWIQPELNRTQGPVSSHRLPKRLASRVPYLTIYKPQVSQRRILLECHREVLGTGIGDVVPAEGQDPEGLVAGEPLRDAFHPCRTRVQQGRPVNNKHALGKSRGPRAWSEFSRRSRAWRDPSCGSCSQRNATPSSCKKFCLQMSTPVKKTQRA